MNHVFYDADYAAAAAPEGPQAHLPLELGWSEVRRGLGLILRGYLLLILAYVLFGVILGVILGMSAQDRAKIPWQVRDISLFLGLGLLGLFTIYCYGCVIVGHWRCLLNAPERRGARWLMFACLTCILAGPGLNLAANLTGVNQKPKLEKGMSGIKEIKLTTEGAVMQVGSIGLSMAGNCLFILFLRAVASCFEDRARVVVIDIYLGFTALLLGATVWVVVTAPDWETLILHALVLGLGWAANFIGYLIIILLVRGAIRRGLRQLAPCEPSSLPGPLFSPGSNLRLG